MLYFFKKCLDMYRYNSEIKVKDENTFLKFIEDNKQFIQD